MRDPSTAKQALLQVFMAFKDTTSPWQAVRSAWAHSMHDVEQGVLTWDNSTKWALNRLSSSQIAMTNSHIITTSSVPKKICKYYEKLCSHEGNHSTYKHNCSFCARQGRQLQHPELKAILKKGTKRK